MIKIKSYNTQYVLSFSQLIDECFGIKLSDPLELVQWKFHTELFGYSHLIICGYDGETIISQYSNIFHEFSYRNIQYFGYLCQDMCVSPTYRGQGLISKMSKELYSHIQQKSFSIGFSNSEGVKVDIHSKSYGYSVVQSLTSYYLPVFFRSKGYDFHQVQSGSELLESDLCRYNLFDDFLTFSKTQKYLSWRYFEKPGSDYIFYNIVEGGINIGYCVFTFQDNVATLFDFNCVLSIDRTFENLVHTFKAIAGNHRCRILRIIVLDNLFWKEIFSGFFTLNKKEDIYLTAKIHNSFNEFNILDSEIWGITGGDIL